MILPSCQQPTRAGTDLIRANGPDCASSRRNGVEKRIRTSHSSVETGEDSWQLIEPVRCSAACACCCGSVCWVHHSLQKDQRCLTAYVLKILSPEKAPVIYIPQHQLHLPFLLQPSFHSLLFVVIIPHLSHHTLYNHAFPILCPGEPSRIRWHRAPHHGERTQQAAGSHQIGNSRSSSVKTIESILLYYGSTGSPLSWRDNRFASGLV